MKELNVFTGKKIAANVVKVADEADKVKSIAADCQKAECVRYRDLVRLNAAVRKIGQYLFTLMKEAEAQKTKSNKG